MFIISGGRGTGKTKALLQKAADDGAIIACAEPKTMRERAYKYGIFGLEFIAYEDVAAFKSTCLDKPVLLYIHDINKFIETHFSSVSGYSLSFND
jgi:geranylgeranyl pyrophosphate synthase